MSQASSSFVVRLPPKVLDLKWQVINTTLLWMTGPNALDTDDFHYASNLLPSSETKIKLKRRGTMRWTSTITNQQYQVLQYPRTVWISTFVGLLAANNGRDIPTVCKRANSQTRTEIIRHALTQAWPKPAKLCQKLPNGDNRSLTLNAVLQAPTKGFLRVLIRLPQLLSSDDS
ncbi:hypothetical protein K445DRAFT_13022 [Daldinia sp. EC12]|nr:hypothetical protein K445DRAFT_13022 [Daldinia sp. EC12]